MRNTLLNLSNVELLKQFESALARHVNYPDNKTIEIKFLRLEKELATRLGLSETDLKHVKDW